jgi:glycerophosphoryl diester phosphodiesterase
MRDPWKRQPGEQPRVFAHRGRSGEAFDNTLTAFQAAIDAGVDGIEIDVSMTSDGRLVCFHDRDLGRVAGLDDRVRNVRYQRLRAIFFEGHERVPTLDEAFDVVGPGMPVILDVKAWHGLDVAMVPPLARLLRRRQAECAPNVTVSSFNYLVLVRLLATLPWLRIGFLFEPGSIHSTIGMWGRLSRSYHAVHPHRSLVSPLSVERWHRKGWTVASWTVNEPDEARRMADAGVDIIISDSLSSMS